jgi:hypothetical protein
VGGGSKRVEPDGDVGEGEEGEGGEGGGQHSL